MRALTKVNGNFNTYHVGTSANYLVLDSALRTVQDI